jgi:hypothetical protein
MKKFIGILAGVTLLAAGFGFVSCATTKTTTTTTTTTAPATKKNLGGVPDFVNQAYLNASEDTIVGIGTYKVGLNANGALNTSRMGTAKTFAETRARADITRQLDVIVKDMVTDYAAQSELDDSAALSFQEDITQTLAKQELVGAHTTQMNTDENGVLWVVMEYSKSAAAKSIQDAYDASTAAKKLAPAAGAAFSALDRMDKAWNDATSGGDMTPDATGTTGAAADDSSK